MFPGECGFATNPNDEETAGYATLFFTTLYYYFVPCSCTVRLGIVAPLGLSAALPGPTVAVVAGDKRVARPLEGSTIAVRHGARGQGA